MKFKLPMTPKARPRVKVPRTGMPYTPNNGSRAVIDAIGMETGVWGSHPQHTPIRVDVRFVMPRHKQRPPWLPPEVWKLGCRYWTVVRPDRDNLDKTLLEGLEEGGLLYEDAQAVSGYIEKVHAARDEEPHYEVVVSCLDWTVDGGDL